MEHIYDTQGREEGEGLTHAQRDSREKLSARQTTDVHRREANSLVSFSID